jgi:hypothetical protein
MTPNLTGLWRRDLPGKGWKCEQLAAVRDVIH